jgi:hypothetical protein
MGRNKKQYDANEAKLVQACAQYREPQEETAARLNMCVETMMRLYRKEWETGKREADLKVRKTLFEMASSGKNTVATIFYCKTQLGMKETNKVEMSSPDGSMSPKATKIDLSSFTPEQLIEMGRAAFRGE